MKRVWILFIALFLAFAAIVTSCLVEDYRRNEEERTTNFEFSASDVCEIRIEVWYSGITFSDREWVRIEHLFREIKNAGYEKQDLSNGDTPRFTVYMIDEAGNSLAKMDLYEDHSIGYRGNKYKRTAAEEKVFYFIDNLYKCTTSYNKEQMPIPRPDGTELDFWIADDITDEMLNAELAFGDGQYLDSAYSFVKAPDSEQFNTSEDLPEKCVYYRTETYTDYLGTHRRITSVRITDPSVNIFGVNAYSTLNAFAQALEESFSSDPVITQDAKHQAIEFKSDSISIKLYKDLESSIHYIEMELIFADLGYQLEIQ